MTTVYPHRFGSDCEFGFFSVRSWEVTHIPANRIIGRGNTGTSFIGLDGHAATAEIRPRPSHNVRKHLLDVAQGILATDQYLRENDKWKGVSIVAVPFYQGETFGGHLHCSFFEAIDPIETFVVEHQLYVDAVGVIRYRANDNKARLSADQEKSIAKWWQRINNGVDLTGIHPSFTTTMNYLLLPLERWAQPWYERQQRNQRYGVGRDMLRNQETPRPDRPRFARDHYRHLEYRVPSTWLVHPTLAYAYAALAKLSMLNYNRIPVDRKNDLFAFEESANPNNNEYRRVLLERYTTLIRGGAIVSNDLKELPSALETIDKAREKWFAPLTPVAVDKWKALLQ